MGPGTPRDDETNSPLPLPFKKKQGSNVSPTNFIEEGDDRILEPGAKVVVTEIALDDWIIQQYGYSLENFPRNVTDTNMNTKLFDAYSVFDPVMASATTALELELLSSEEDW